MSEKYVDLHNMERAMNSSQNEALNNVYKIIKIKESLGNKKIVDQNDLFKYMKSIKMDINYENGNERILYTLYEKLIELSRKELIEYTIEIIREDNSGIGPFISEQLSGMMFQKIKNSYEDVLICNIEKYGVELYDFIKDRKENFFLTVRKDLKKLFESLFDLSNVSFIDSDIYDYNFVIKKFDLILCFPIMGSRLLMKGNKDNFISEEPSFIATENLLYHLKTDGELLIILPSKIGFGGGDVRDLRKYIQYNYKINEISSLPPKLFYPYLGINTYFLSFSLGKTETVMIKKYELNSQELFEKDSRLLFDYELEKIDTWNVDIIFSSTDEDILSYQNSMIKKATIGEIADVFRGKAIVEKNDRGIIGVINISNISELGIDYDNIDTINEEERKVARYELKNGDVLITTKGFAIKTAVFEEQQRKCIASSNLCVIRPNFHMINSTYLKLFLDSEIGMKLLRSLQRGNAIVNINYQDLRQIEVPIPSMDEQIEIANEYNAGLKLYKETIKNADIAWNAIKNSVQKKLF